MAHTWIKRYFTVMVRGPEEMLKLCVTLQSVSISLWLIRFNSSGFFLYLYIFGSYLSCFNMADGFVGRNLMNNAMFFPKKSCACYKN